MEEVKIALMSHQFMAPVIELEGYFLAGVLFPSRARCGLQLYSNGCDVEERRGSHLVLILILPHAVLAASVLDASDAPLQD
jgi:hypothetical protein